MNPERLQWCWVLGGGREMWISEGEKDIKLTGSGIVVIVAVFPRQ